MKVIRYLAILLFTALPVSGAELVELTSVDGRTIRVLIDDYRPDTGQVAVRINGQGRIISFSENKLTKESKQVLADWHEHKVVLDLLKCKIQREPDGKGKARYKMTIRNAAMTDIDQISLKYTVPVKIDKMVEDTEKSTAKKRVYNRVSEKTVMRGEIDVGTVKAQGTVTFYTDNFDTTHIQVCIISQQKGNIKEKEYRLINSSPGARFALYMDDKLMRNIDSRNDLAGILLDYTGKD